MLNLIRYGFSERMGGGSKRKSFFYMYLCKIELTKYKQNIG